MVIVYQSKTGFTQQYAELLGESELVEVLPLKEAEQKLPSGTPVLFLGPLSAGRIAGLKRARKAFLLQGVCGVGMSPPSPELTEKLRQDNQLGDLPVFYLQLGDLPVFYLQGGWAPDRVNPMTRAMVNLVTRSTRRELQAKGADRTPQEEAMLDMLLHGGSFVSPDNLPSLQNWLSKQ